MWARVIHLLHAEEIRSYFMDHLQSKEDIAQGGVEEAPDPEDLAAQVCPYCLHLHSSQSSDAGEMPEGT